MGLAVPGPVLTGWAPASAATRPVHLVLRDIEGGERSSSLRAGVEFGLDEVLQGTRVRRSPVEVHRVAGDAQARVPFGRGAVDVVVAAEDDRYPYDDARSTGPRIYTCPLLEWRPDAWSVASAMPGRWASAGPDWHHALDTPEANLLNRRFRVRAGMPMDEAAWRGWMAVRVALDVGLRVDAGEDDLLAFRFDGHKGQPLRFSEDGHLVQPTCRAVGGRVELVAAVDHDNFADLD